MEKYRAVMWFLEGLVGLRKEVNGAYPGTVDDAAIPPGVESPTEEHLLAVVKGADDLVGDLNDAVKASDYHIAGYSCDCGSCDQVPAATGAWLEELTFTRITLEGGLGPRAGTEARADFLRAVKAWEGSSDWYSLFV